ncbi:MAG: type I-C CRISPR-associated protein Cas7/Csd2 [Desulfobacterales bacterium CG07_land_8_20_14_0_80_52_14]|nr:MAG: type I-C CRISPR-associated protein Cas7/Csd2 [Desulfobacterales bacterium CG07_land_8_20_14_0_80_52_14]
MSLTNKIDFAVVFRVQNANPNGDPLNGNRPRVAYDGTGEVTDVCLKRKIRNRLMEMNMPIFVQSDDNKVDKHPNLKSRANEVLSAEKTVEGKIDKACKTWFDVRTFGQVFPFKAQKKGKGKEAEETSDDKGTSFGIRGPVSVQSAFSVSSVLNSVTSNQITKSTSLEGDGIQRQSDQMGMKHRVDRGIYVFYGSMNPQLSVKPGFSDKDAAAIKAVLPRLFENDASSARPEGSMEVLKVVWWQHNCASGQASSAKVHRSMIVKDTDDLNNLLSFEPGKGPIDSSGNWPKPEIIEGV